MPGTEARGTMRQVAFLGRHDSRGIRPLMTPLVKPHYEGLARGQLLLPRCRRCERVRVPAAPACPWCASGDVLWIEAAAKGEVHSWVRYHRAYLPQFEALVPYVVLAVKVPEGPVLFGRSLPGGIAPAIGQPAHGVVEQWPDGFCGLAFELSGAGR